MIDRKIAKVLIDKWTHSPHDYSYQIYGIVTPRKHGEFTLTCYAVKETKRLGLRMTEVNRAWSDRPYYQCKDIWKNVWGSTFVEFDERKNRPDESYGWYGGKWGRKMNWRDGDSWFLPYVKYLNLDALAETKYKYCAYDKYHGNLSLMAYCRLFDRHKEVELLSKASLWELVNERFLDSMAKDKGLRDFFRCHAKELIKPVTLKTYTPNEVRRAYRHGWTLEHAHMVEYARYALKSAPKGIDRTELAKYLHQNDIDIADYLRYAEIVEQAKEDILAFGNAFPKDFHAKVAKMKRKVAIAQAKEDREREAALRKIAERANALLERMGKRLAWRVGEYSVIVPTTRRQFEDEGRAMHNCIGGYFDDCADGRTMCFFIRRKGKRLADVEANPASGKILQCRAIYNGNTDTETKQFAEVFTKRLVADMKRRAA